MFIPALQLALNQQVNPLQSDTIPEGPLRGLLYQKSIAKYLMGCWIHNSVLQSDLQKVIYYGFMKGYGVSMTFQMLLNFKNMFARSSISCLICLSTMGSYGGLNSLFLLLRELLFVQGHQMHSMKLFNYSVCEKGIKTYVCYCLN